MSEKIAVAYPHHNTALASRRWKSWIKDKEHLHEDIKAVINTQWFAGDCALYVNKEAAVPQFTVETEICLKIKVEFNATKGSYNESTHDELEIVEIALENQVVSSELLNRLQETHQDELEEVCWDEVYRAVAGNLERRLSNNGTA